MYPLVTCALGLVSLVIIIVYWLVRRQFSYWKHHGIPSLQPIFPFGTVKDARQTVQISEMAAKQYTQMKGKGPFCGIYISLKPAILALDLEFIKSVLVKDFSSFENRGGYYNEKDDPLSAHLFAIDTPMWRTLRKKLTPTFTSGKMKFMYPTVIEVAERFQEHMHGLVHETKVFVEIKELLARFTTDVIGTCAFGIECNSLLDQDAIFRRMGKKTLTERRHSGPVVLFMLAFSRIARLFRMKLLPDDVTTFFLRIVRETVEYRETNGIQRNDFMDLLINLKNEKDPAMDSITINEIAAQAFVFFLAGFETSSTTMTFCLYELALNAEVQNKARKEIRMILNKHHGKFTYEAMMEMKYLDQIINGILHKLSIFQSM